MSGQHISVGESRQDLLNWLNDLLLLGYTKIEQIGTGAAVVQVLDSIYRDVNLNKVKFNANSEYQYVANFKVLQSLFDKHKINNHIPVERLVKCKMQDNLEFLQMIKKLWDLYYPGGSYDAVARRNSSGARNAPSAKSTSSLDSPKKAVRAAISADTPKKPLRAAVSTSSNIGKTDPLIQQNMELKLTIAQVEKEREFVLLI